MAYKVSTQNYSGPFDLLLYLVTHHRVTIGSISLSEIAEQYLQEVQAMSELDLDMSSDFLLIAASLLEMKAASLLPDDDESHTSAQFATEHSEFDEELGDDFSQLSPDEAREVLIARLLAYKQYRSAALNLRKNAEDANKYHPRTTGPDPEFHDLMPDYLEGITPRTLGVMCADVLAHRETLLLEAEHIAPQRVPLQLAMAALDRSIRCGELKSFFELLGSDLRPKTLVVNFLALLELYKRGYISMQQDLPFSDIKLAARAESEAFDPEGLDPKDQLL